MAPIYQASQADKTHKQALGVIKKNKKIIEASLMVTRRLLSSSEKHSNRTT